VNKKYISLITKVLFFIFIFHVKVFALAPPNPKIYNVFVSSSSANIKAQSSKAKVPVLPNYKKSSSKRSISNTGIVKPLIILIEFSDVKHDAVNTISYYDNLCFNGVIPPAPYNTQTVSLKDYYYENSGGKLIVSSSTVSNPLKWLTSSHTMAYYGEDVLFFGIDNKNGYIYELAREAVQKLEAETFDFSEFDGNGDGIIDCVMIVHAGQGEENSMNPNTIWSHNWEIPGGQTVTSSGGGTYKIVEYSMVSEYSPLGIFAHEFAHSLSPTSIAPGLPDLYNTITGENGVGSWCLMDEGCWLDDGWIPSHLSAWCKSYLNWGSIETLNETSSVSHIYPSSAMDNNSSTNEFYKIPIPNSPNEYFLLEYRLKTGGLNKYDTSLPGEGMLIWHIDENIIYLNLLFDTINADSSHRGIDLEEADNVEDKISENTDVFGLSYKQFASPQSNGYDNKTSNIKIFNINGVLNNFMTFELETPLSVNPDVDSTLVIASSKFQSIKKIFNYPNPVKDNSTKINILCSKRVENGKLRIYNIVGELIYDKTITDDDLKSSSDYNWDYEINWNCQNIYGHNVASGIYIYIFTSDNDKKTGKLAVLR
jgi:M6 family metalloprotease-like protein